MGKRLLYLVLGALLIFLALWLLGPRYGIDLQQIALDLLNGSTEETHVTASGVIEAETREVASSHGGRVVAVYAGPGDTVTTGQLLAALDTTLIDAQINAAAAAVEVAQATLRLAEAGVAPGQIAIAEAQLAHARIAADVTAGLLEDAQAYAANPQLLRLQAEVAQAQVESARYRLNEAGYLRDAATVAQDAFFNARDSEGDTIQVSTSGNLEDLLSGPLVDLIDSIPDAVLEPIENRVDGTYHVGDYRITIEDGQYTLSTDFTITLPFAAHLTPNTYWQSWIGVNSAGAQLAGAEAYAAATSAQANNPLDVQAQVTAVGASLLQAEAEVALAEAYLDALRAGAAPEQIAAVAAQVEQAQAVLDRLTVQREQLFIYAPCDCLVLEQNLYGGELAAPGAAVLTLGDLRAVTLVIYVQETDLGTVSVGQTLAVTLEALPGQRFTGTVRRIADEAEFTPRNVSTPDERVNLVFAVEVALDNPDGLLLPGMTGEAVLQ
ncbi:MAG: efflux RND transporter periplasmic adaptor subunit [Anaerolineae bacterium]|nr:efflux RND transporter periplasmic adaptor subunit [Anaerolineae bacterium]